MLAEVVLATAAVVTGNVAADAPAGTVTVGEGNVAVGELLVSVTVTAEAATPVSVTVPVVPVPPWTLDGDTETEDRAGAFTVNLAVFVTAPEDAVRVAVVVVATGPVVTGNVALVAPAGTVTVDEARAAAGELLVRVTVTADTAAAFSVTVPVVPAPPRTEDGDTERAVKAGAFTVSELLTVAPPKEAVSATLTVADRRERRNGERRRRTFRQGSSPLRAPRRPHRRKTV